MQDVTKVTVDTSKTIIYLELESIFRSLKWDKMTNNQSNSKTFLCSKPAIVVMRTVELSRISTSLYLCVRRVRGTKECWYLVGNHRIKTTETLLSHTFLGFGDCWCYIVITTTT